MTDEILHDFQRIFKGVREIKNRQSSREFWKRFRCGVFIFQTEGISVTKSKHITRIICSLSARNVKTSRLSYSEYDRWSFRRVASTERLSRKDSHFADIFLVPFNEKLNTARKLSVFPRVSMAYARVILVRTECIMDL